ncbi:MAG: tRNA (adenosine(37)-N6)-threonylcarbamoyltransferase complex dimerization subunit type 1 TsaB [Bryobacteraceae bacterium]|nr:tRNA (adenosine(37)-N6)-threonylcarbamoyltransferase complex dimerization subunit type 1 TsaB [Bryobacteraceae bacterium]
MYILALDTTGTSGSLALQREDVLLEEVLLSAPGGFSTTLYSGIADLLGRHNVALSSIDCFAAASGPGSFTGVRIGLAAVKSMAEALGKNATGVSTLEALAWYGSADLRASVLDARRGEVYAAVFRGNLEVVSPEVVVPFQFWVSTLPLEEVGEFIGLDLQPFRNSLPASALMTERGTLASGVAAIARTRLLRNESGDPVTIEANYVKRCDAEVLWQQAN